LKPLFGAVPKVALRLVDVDEFSLAAQSSGHQVGTTSLALRDIIKFGLKVLPLSLLGSKLLLSLEVAYSHIVSLNHELAS